MLNELVEQETHQPNLYDFQTEMHENRAISNCKAARVAKLHACVRVRRAHLFPGSDPRSFARPGLRLFPGVVYKRQTGAMV